MAAKKKKDMSWDQIGQAIGKKIEKGKWEDCSSWKKQFKVHQEDGGFFGRLLFIIGVMVALNHLGYVTGLVWWVYLLIIAGFALMKL